VVLTVIYAREGRLEDALQIFEELKLAAPHNHVLRINRAWVLFRLGRYREAADSYAEAIAVARPEARFKREEVRLLQANALLQAGEPGPGFAITRDMLAVEVLDAALAVRTKLLSAHCLDALGRREEAVALYREVAAAKSADGSRTAARRGMRQPYQPATPPDLGEAATTP
jgi:tetratricopeptide (TPR) repeat protein